MQRYLFEICVGVLVLLLFVLLLASAPTKEQIGKQARTAAILGIPASANPFIGRDTYSAKIWLEVYMEVIEENKDKTAHGSGQ